jgi:hypothetical protein
MALTSGVARALLLKAATLIFLRMPARGCIFNGIIFIAVRSPARRGPVFAPGFKSCKYAAHLIPLRRQPVRLSFFIVFFVPVRFPV